MLRYTVVLDTGAYTTGVRAAVARLQADGIVAPVSLKNYWGGGDGYQGINDVRKLKLETFQ
jgi:hypothetical protein